MLTYKQFQILELLIASDSSYSQRELAQELAMSLGSVNKLIGELNQLSYLSNTALTPEGLHVMEQYRVKRAVIMAAGFGSRMLPLTLNTPKPLVRVRGKRLIDGALDGLLAAGIREIYIVRGYLGEQFDQLLFKYPMIQFIENPLYNESNNISSAYLSRTLFENSYILDADLWIQAPDVIKTFQYRSNYLCAPVSMTNDWCFHGKKDKIETISIGGVDCYKWIGISFWTPEDGKKLSLDIKKAFHSPGGKERFWDQVPLELYKNNYSVFLRPCEENDVIEIDSYRELTLLDPAYLIPADHI